MSNFFKKIFAKGKKSLKICHPELVSGSDHQQKYSANRTQKSNFRQLCTTYKMPCRAAFTLAEVFSPYCYPPRRIAFTLAEVLITLGIIGVVAVMTLPTLIQNYQKHITVNRLKVNYNILNNAVRRAEADFGEITT